MDGDCERVGDGEVGLRVIGDCGEVNLRGSGVESLWERCTAA